MLTVIDDDLWCCCHNQLRPEDSLVHCRRLLAAPLASVSSPPRGYTEWSVVGVGLASVVPVP